MRERDRGGLECGGFVDIPKVLDHHSTQGQPNRIPPHEPSAGGASVNSGEAAEDQEPCAAYPAAPGRKPQVQELRVEDQG